MLPTIFGFTRYPTDSTPGQAWLWWALVRGQLEHAITHIGGCDLNHAGLTGDALRASGLFAYALDRAGLTGDRLES